ncbi:hypothetical protein VTI74DRAFT_10183 [Chaetomium olivicolor]
MCPRLWPQPAIVTHRLAATFEPTSPIGMTAHSLASTTPIFTAELHTSPERPGFYHLDAQRRTQRYITPRFGEDLSAYTRAMEHPKKPERLFDAKLNSAPACLGMGRFFNARDNCDENFLFPWHKQTAASLYIGAALGKPTVGSAAAGGGQNTCFVSQSARPGTFQRSKKPPAGNLKGAKVFEIAGAPMVGGSNNDKTLGSNTTTSFKAGDPYKPQPPQRDPDGTCAIHLIQNGDTCDALARRYHVTVSELDGFLAPYQEGTSRVLQQLGNLRSVSRPLEIHVVDGDGPGNKAKGCQSTCVFNCGTDIKVNSGQPAAFQRIGYYESYYIGRDCLWLGAKGTSTDGIDTHVHWAYSTEPANFGIIRSAILQQRHLCH